jgi:hypothetical protein
MMVSCDFYSSPPEEDAVSFAMRQLPAACIMPACVAAGTNTPGEHAQFLNFEVAALHASRIEGRAWTG